MTPYHVTLTLADGRTVEHRIDAETPLAACVQAAGKCYGRRDVVGVNVRKV